MKESFLLSLLFVGSSASAAALTAHEIARSSNSFGWSVFTQLQQSSRQ